jgi:hypothetical protein
MEHPIDKKARTGGSRIKPSILTDYFRADQALFLTGGYASKLLGKNDRPAWNEGVPIGFR